MLSHPPTGEAADCFLAKPGEEKRLRNLCFCRLVACAGTVLKRLQLTARVEAGASGKNDGMNAALIVIVLLLLFVPFVLVGVLFVWGAVQDGQEDRAVQRLLGIRRRTRLGR